MTEGSSTRMLFAGVRTLVCLLLCCKFCSPGSMGGVWVAPLILLRDERSVSNCGNTPYPCQVGSV